VLEVTEHPPITCIQLARTFLGRPLYRVYAYLVDGVLVDSGPPSTAAELVAWCRGRDLRLVVNTHYHEDHSGGDAALQRNFRLRILAPPETVARLARFYGLPLYRAIVWGQPRDVVVETLGEVLESERYRFRVVATPGHADDHVCLFEPREGWLFSGDLFIHERVRYMRRVEDVRQHIDSLRRVLELSPATMFCSHAGVVADPMAAISRKIEYWEDLGHRAEELRARGLSLPRIRTTLLGREGSMALISYGAFSKLNLIRSLLRE
jgi:endoribonuclease LACTB2